MGGGATTTGGPAKSPRPGRPKKTETPAAAGCGVASAKRPRNMIARIVFFMGLPPCPGATTAVAQRYDARAQAPTKVRTGERRRLEEERTEVPSQPAELRRSPCSPHHARDRPLPPRASSQRANVPELRPCASRAGGRSHTRGYDGHVDEELAPSPANASPGRPVSARASPRSPPPRSASGQGHS